MASETESISLLRTFLISITICASCVSFHSVNALGKRTHGESCSIGGHITSFFSSEREERTCASDQGLICTGRCSCPLGRVFESSATVFGKPSDGNDPGCYRAAGTPCYSGGGSGGSSSNQKCVYNGHCEFGFCICDPGYKSRRGHCIKTSSSDEDDSKEDSSSKNKYPSLADIFNNINNHFQSGRPDSSGSGSSNRFPNTRPAANNNDFDLSGFPITRPAHDEFNNFPITRPAAFDDYPYPIARPPSDDFTFPITRPYQDEESNFYHTRPLHEELLRPDSDGGKVLFPDD